MTKHTLNYGVTPVFIGHGALINYLPNWKPFFEKQDIPVVLCRDREAAARAALRLLI